MAKDKLSSLVNDSNIAFLLDKNILTANLVVRFNTRSKIYKNDTEVKKALSAVITNINSDDSVLLATKNKQKITAGSTRRCKIITIDDVSGNLPNEESLRQEMVGYLNELRELII